jgi:succinoglycan biosynthesis transport protein ExoP
VQAAKQREANLQQQLVQAQSKASTTATVQAELTQLEKDADARRLLYQNLLQRAEQTDKQGPEQTYTTVVSKAEAPTTPSSPRPKLAAALGMVGGFAFGGFLGMLRKRGSESFSAPDEIADETGLAALATVPRMTGRAKARGLPAAVLAAPAGPEAEAVRLLRTRLRFVGRGAVPRSLLFVSSTAGEGASSLAAAFARLAALDGLRVLLLEGDLQGPSLARMLDLPPSNGIVETLVGHEHWRDAIVRDPHSNLECLVAGGSTPGAGQLLETMQLQNLIAEARDDYNLIVMDSQPLSGATHSLILAHVADAVVLVVAPEEASRQEVHAAKEALVRAARKPPVIAVNKAAS